MSAALDLCSCGDESPHVVATRRTADGAPLLAWSDGSIALVGEASEVVALRALAFPTVTRDASRALGALEMNDADETAEALLGDQPCRRGGSRPRREGYRRPTPPVEIPVGSRARVALGDSDPQTVCCGRPMRTGSVSIQWCGEPEGHPGPCRGMWRNPEDYARARRVAADRDADERGEAMRAWVRGLSARRGWRK